MKVQNLGNGVQRQDTHVVIFDPGEEFLEGMAQVASDENIEVAGFTAIGGFSETVLGFYNEETKSFDSIPFEADQVEVLSLMGEITRENGEPHVHGHVVVGLRDGRAFGGHLLKGVVKPIAIVNLFELAHTPKSHH
jgi:predicted DNA-binding protein with PD1-like motif